MPPPGFVPTALIVHPDHQAAYDSLERAAEEGRKPQQAIWNQFETCWLMIKRDGQRGDCIRRASIPAYFLQRYGTKNLYCIDLKNDVRCFYTIAERDIVFLDIVDHDEYDRWFPPKGRKARRA